MGNTYANVTVVDTTVDDVLAALQGTEAFVAAADGAVVIFAATDEEDGFGQGLTARQLSTTLGRPAFDVLVFDDDLLQYQVFVDGSVADEAALPPEIAAAMMSDLDADGEGEGVPHGSPEHLVAALGRGDPATVARALGMTDLVFVTDLHGRLAEALDLPTWAAGWGHRYLVHDPTALPVPVTRTP